jgi:hypothetical protein
MPTRDVRVKTAGSPIDDDAIPISAHESPTLAPRGAADRDGNSFYLGPDRPLASLMG